MTFRKSFKRIIRARQAKTGESYAAARAQVLAAGPQKQPSWVVELHDVTAQARSAGIVCEVRVTPMLASARSLPRILAQLHDILAGPTEGLIALQRVALRGEPDPLRSGRGSVAVLISKMRTFRAGLEQGLRGPGPGGRILAFGADVDGRERTVLAQLAPRYQRDPLLLLSVFRDDSGTTLFGSFEMWAQLPVRP